MSLAQRDSAYGVDFDPDSDFDPEERKSQPNGFTGRSFFAPVILSDIPFRNSHRITRAKNDFVNEFA
jgi:hypothetical protein